MIFRNVGQWDVYAPDGSRKYTNQGERERFLEQVNRFDASKRALCLVVAYTGCRVSEALSLGPHRLDTERRGIVFQTLKQRRPKFRLVPVPDPLMDLLLALPARDGRFWEVSRVTAWRWISGAMLSAGIRGHMACGRGLRHGFGMHAVRRGVPPNLVQRWLGHASLSTTACYLDAVGLEERQFADRMWLADDRPPRRSRRRRCRRAADPPVPCSAVPDVRRPGWAALVCSLRRSPGLGLLVALVELWLSPLMLLIHGAKGRD